MKLSKKERDALPASAFAVPELREYPLTDANGELSGTHITAAVHYFKMHGHRLTPKQRDVFIYRVCSAHHKLFPDKYLHLLPTSTNRKLSC
jgi:hypothetical protein